MSFYEQISLALLFIVSTNVIVYIVLIKDYQKLSGTYLGPKVGSIIDQSYLGFETSSFKKDKTIFFVDIGCTSCENIIRKLQSKVKQLNNIHIITKGTKNEVDDWKNNKKLLLKINNLNDNSIQENYNIKAFPYYIKIVDNKVSEKGFLNEINLLKLYEEVEE